MPQKRKSAEKRVAAKEIVKEVPPVTVTKDDIYPEEVNQHLLYQITSLNSENEALRDRLKDKDDNIDELSKTISTLKEDLQNLVVIGGPQVSAKSAGIISTKITELCKQNRHLVAELESCKTKYGALERKIIEAEIIHHKNIDIEPTETDNSFSVQDEAKELKEKLASISKKLVDTRNKNYDLKTELLLANKCLQAEIGPNFTSIQKLVSDPIGYKGRAQEIIVLKDRLTYLEEKYGKNKNAIIDHKKENYNQLIKDIEMKRKNNADKVAKDLVALQIEYDKLKNKYERTVARNKILNCEGLQLRETLQTLSDKSLHDEKLKKELDQQQKEVEKQYQQLLKDNNCVNESMKSSYDRLSDDLKNEKFRVDALTKKLEEKNKKIDYLNDKLTKVIESSIQKVYFTPLQIAADNEIKVLAELLNNANKRVEEERKKSLELEKKYLRIKESRTSIMRKCSELERQDSKVSGRKSKSVTSVHSSTMQISMKSSNIFNDIQAPSTCPESCRRLEFESLNNKLEIAEEQIKFLETRLKIIEEERSADIESIDEMIVSSKKIFAEALKKFQEGR